MGIFKRILRSGYHRGLNLSNRFIKPTVWYRSKFVDPDHERYPDNVWYRAHDERNFDVVNLGSSGGKWAFDYTGLPVKGMNWANQPQTLHDDLRLFKNFHSILRDGGKVLIVIMPFTGLDKKTSVMDDFKYLDTLYWDIAQTMPHYGEAMHLKTYPIFFGKPAIKAAIHRLLKRERPVPSPRGLDQATNPMSVTELEADAQHWMDGWARQFGIADFEAPLTPTNQEGRKVRIGVMRELVDFITERGYVPVYVVPPVAGALARRFTPKFREIYYYDFLQQVGREIKTLDYLNDAAFTDDGLYFNSFFLNLRGRKAFTRRVLRDIGLIGEFPPDAGGEMGEESSENCLNV